MTHSHHDNLSDEAAFHLYEQATAAYEQTRDDELAEQEAAAMSLRGLAKLTGGPQPNRLTLLKGKDQSGAYDGPMDVDL